MSAHERGISQAVRDRGYEMLRSRAALGMIDASAVVSYASQQIENGNVSAAFSHAMRVAGMVPACKLIAILVD